MGMAYIRVSSKVLEKNSVCPRDLNKWIEKLGIVDHLNVKFSMQPQFDFKSLTWYVIVHSDMLPNHDEWEPVPHLKALYSDMDVKQWALDVRAEIMGIKVRHVPAD